MSIIIAILSLTLMIIVHEWGHFIAAKIFHVPVYEFAIGMGPKLLKHQGKKETLYTLRAIPLGGFCSFDSEDSLNNTPENGIVDAALDKIPVWQKMIICFAGPLMNILFAFVIMFGVTFFAGEAIPTTQIVDFMEDAPAKEYLQIEDYIYSINDYVVYNNRTELTEAINKEMINNNSLNVTVLRNDNYFTYKITPKYDESTQSYVLGIYQNTKYDKIPVKEAIMTTIDTTKYFITSVYSGLWGLLSGQYQMNEMSGIVGTVAFMGDYVKAYTIIPFLTLVALISVNLGVMNLLPIPALDGSKILISLIEIIIRKPINKKIEAKATLIGFAILIGLSVILIFSDIFKMLQ